MYKNSNEMKRTIVFRLWYNMTFNKDANAKLFFELIESYYELTEKYMYLIIGKSSY